MPGPVRVRHPHSCTWLRSHFYFDFVFILCFYYLFIFIFNIFFILKPFQFNLICILELTGRYLGIPLPTVSIYLTYMVSVLKYAIFLLNLPALAWSCGYLSH